MSAKDTPISERDLLKEWDKDIRALWFPEHVATVVCDQEVKAIRWSKPNTNIYRAYYILRNNTLAVYGDIGEAVYSWSEKISVPFLKGCDFHYFAGKCLASETGRKYEEFDSDVAAFEVDQWMKDGEGRSKREQSVVDLIKDEPPIYKEDFERLGVEAYDLTGDSELCGMISRFGVVPSIRCLGHWVGLKMMNL